MRPKLRVMAARYMGRENQGHTLQRTALVHEAYFKLIDQDLNHIYRAALLAFNNEAAAARKRFGRITVSEGQRRHQGRSPRTLAGSLD